MDDSGPCTWFIALIRELSEEYQLHIPFAIEPGFLQYAYSTHVVTLDV